MKAQTYRITSNLLDNGGEQGIFGTLVVRTSRRLLGVTLVQEDKRDMGRNNCWKGAIRRERFP